MARRGSTASGSSPRARCCSTPQRSARTWRCRSRSRSIRSRPVVAAKVVALARGAGIDESWLDRPIAALDEAIRIRAHLARAIALDPSLLILEHPTARLGAGEGQAFGEVVARIAGGRAMATLIISGDEAFSAVASTRRLALHGATGDLKPPRKRLFGFLDLFAAPAFLQEGR